MSEQHCPTYRKRALQHWSFAAMGSLALAACGDPASSDDTSPAQTAGDMSANGVATGPDGAPLTEPLPGAGGVVPGSPSVAPNVPAVTEPGAVPSGVATPGTAEPVPNGVTTPGTAPTPQVTEPGPSTASAAAEQCATLGAGVHAGSTKLRRLTQLQFNNTVRDLLGIEGEPASAFSLDEHIGPFQSNAIASITSLLVQQHDEVATSLAQQALPRMAELSPCDLNGGAVCVAEFAQSFGTRVYRRPLEASEVQEYVDLFAVGSAQGGAEGGFLLMLEVLLQSPNFIYHSEVGVTGAPSSAPTALTSYELASRLSYFLWNTMPDTELFELAAADQLQDNAVLSAQVVRMLADDKAEDAVPYFHTQWLGLDGLSGINKDQTLFPQFNPELSAAMLAETRHFTDYVVRQGDGLMGTLFTADFSFPEGPLFSLYGLSEPAGFAPGSPVTLNPGQRKGLLTQAAFLTQHSHPNQTSPVHRGLRIRENLLCTPVQPPPPEVSTTPPSPMDATSTRERFAQHSADPSCGPCHQLMDPIGLGFENYDAIGAFRSEDGLGLVDASGEILGGRDSLAGPFVGALELADKLASSGQVAECLTNQWFRFALGRIESADDACTMQVLHEQFSASNHNVRELLSQIALSDAFRHVRYVNGEL